MQTNSDTCKNPQPVEPVVKEQYRKLDGKKAIGVDKVTKAGYGEKPDENLTILIKKIRRGTYKPRPARITEIPKEDGSTRPLAISCLEDKLVKQTPKFLAHLCQAFVFSKLTPLNHRMPGRIIIGI